MRNPGWLGTYYLFRYSKQARFELNKPFPSVLEPERGGKKTLFAVFCRLRADRVSRGMGNPDDIGVSPGRLEQVYGSCLGDTQ
jgi:hypothetical protein